MAMSKATVFEFTSYKFEPAKKRVVFNYKTEFEGKDSLFFTETILLPSAPDYDNKELVDTLLKSLHIILGISYYKFYCPPKVVLPYQLSKKEANFWNAVYKKGLGEFFYKNNLDPKISPKFPFKKGVENRPVALEKNDRCLVGVGGGKDSIVSAELLKQNNVDVTAFSVHTGKKSDLIDGIVEKIGAKNIAIQRFLNWQVYQDHQYSGHVPISAIYAFLGVFAAVLYRHSYVIVSNEYSSNFGNITYRGQAINHQWSKSFEFERLFQEYVKDFISPDIVYFSLLRPFYEIRIVKLFSEIGKKYFSIFSSCNRNFSSVRKASGGLWPASNAKRSFAGWCGECPKCVFVFTLLSAFLSKKELVKIFGKNLYGEKDLLPLFKDILGFGKIKPFDCVGTFEEAQTAMYLSKNKFKNDFIVKQLGKKVKYFKDVFKTQKESNVLEQFRFLGIESALILGYGKEGRATQKFLKKYYPKLKIGIADAERGKNYLKGQDKFDIAVKTPGIKKELIKIPYTTATNIFFSKVLGKNLIIGVTGSKGKSTTFSLIYEILKMAGKKVELLGNIGNPMLESLTKTQNLKSKIYALELSSYQLDDLKFSPDIAVLTNLFPEHMDYHGGIKNYYQAKKNIINFQNSQNYFIYNSQVKIVKSWLKDYQGKAIQFNKINLNNIETKLIGEHNQNNIKAAIAFAKILNISDAAIKKAIKNFKPLPNRLEFVGKFKGIEFYNDASSTNPESSILAIKSLKNIDTILLGGEDRGYDFKNLEKALRKYKIRNVVLFPDSGKKILKSKAGFNILSTKSMEEAVRFAYKNTKKGSVCLLSGASPSYSLWKNFEEKGSQFKYFVKKLHGKKSP